MYINGREPRKCPAEFQRRLTQRFGLNRFGDPNFKIMWGASEFVRIGDVRRDKHGTERKGFKDEYLCHGMACWNILRWKPNYNYGTDDLWYMRTWDFPVKGMHFMGEYPWRGRYEIVQPLMWHEWTPGKTIVELMPKVLPNGMIIDVPTPRVVGREMIVHHMPLSHLLLDEIIPLLVHVERLTDDERRAAKEMVKRHEAWKKKQEVAQLADEMMEALPRTYGPVSFSQQGCRTSVIDKKMEQIQNAMKRIMRRGKMPVYQKGFQMGNAPQVVGKI